MKIYRNGLYLLVYIVSISLQTSVENREITPTVGKKINHPEYSQKPGKELKEYPLEEDYILNDFHRPDITKKELILDIEWKFSTLVYGYLRRGDISRYYARDGYIFRLIKQCSKILWDPSDYSKCAEVVEYDEGNQIVIIYRLDGIVEEIQLELVVVDIKNKNHSKVTIGKDEWEDSEVFTPVSPFLIAGVKNGDTFVWESDNCDHADKLFLRTDEVGNTIVELHYPQTVSLSKLVDQGDDFSDLLSYHFSKEVNTVTLKYNDKLVWETKEYPDGKPLRFTKKGSKIGFGNTFNIEVFTKGSTEPNDNTKYNFVKPSSTEGHFVFKFGVKCTEVKVDGDSLWKHNLNDYGGTYPKCVSYHAADLIEVIFSDFYLVLTWLEGTWEGIFYDYLNEENDENLAQESEVQHSQDQNQLETHTEVNNHDQKENQKLILKVNEVENQVVNQSQKNTESKIKDKSITHSGASETHTNQTENNLNESETHTNCKNESHTGVKSQDSTETKKENKSENQHNHTQDPTGNGVVENGSKSENENGKQYLTSTEGSEKTKTSVDAQGGGTGTDPTSQPPESSTPEEEEEDEDTVELSIGLKYTVKDQFCINVHYTPGDWAPVHGHIYILAIQNVANLKIKEDVYVDMEFILGTVAIFRK